MKTGIGSHQSSKMLKDEWLTPPDIIKSLGPFDLDPCSPKYRPWDTAELHFDIRDDGLSKEWFGRVWCNPPYGKHTGCWLKKLADHGNGIALIFARTETKMFFDQVWDRASAIYFIKGRIRFHHVDGTKGRYTGGAPSCLVAYGGENIPSLECLTLNGKLVILNNDV